MIAKLSPAQGTLPGLHHVAKRDAAQNRAIALLEERFHATGELMPPGDVAAAIGRTVSAMEKPGWAEYRRVRREIQARVWQNKREEFLRLLDVSIRESGCCPAAKGFARAVGISLGKLFEDKEVEIAYREKRRKHGARKRGSGPSLTVTRAIEWLEKQAQETEYLPAVSHVAELFGITPQTLHASDRFMAAYREAGRHAKPVPIKRGGGRLSKNKPKAIQLLRRRAKNGTLPTKQAIAKQLGIDQSRLSSWPEFLAEYDRLAAERRAKAAEDMNGLVDRGEAMALLEVSAGTPSEWEVWCPWLDERKLQCHWRWPGPGRQSRKSNGKMAYWRRTDLETIAARRKAARKAVETNGEYVDGLGTWVPEREAARRCDAPLVFVCSVRVKYGRTVPGVRILFLKPDKAASGGPPSKGQKTPRWPYACAFFHVEDLPTLKTLAEAGNNKVNSARLEAPPGLPTHPTDEPWHLEDFSQVRTDQGTHHFTKTQATCVGVMWKAAVRGQEEMHHKTILAEAGSEADRLRDVFRIGGQTHPAWGTFIVPCKRRGYFSLRPRVGQYSPDPALSTR